MTLGVTGASSTVKAGFLLTHLNTWTSFLSHCVLAGEVMSHSVPERNLIVAFIKEEKRQKHTFTMLHVGQEENHNNTKYQGFFEVTYFSKVFQPQKLTS